MSHLALARKSSRALGFSEYPIVGLRTCDGFGPITVGAFRGYCTPQRLCDSVGIERAQACSSGLLSLHGARERLSLICANRDLLDQALRRLAWGGELQAGERILAKDNKDFGGESPASSSEHHHGSERSFEQSRERMRAHSGSHEADRSFSINNIANDNEARALAGSAALIGLAALLEPELFGGMLLGAGAVYASRSFPLIGGVLRPLMRGAIRVGYAATAKASEMIAEASEDFQDIVAEARADYQSQEPSGTQKH